MKKYIIQATLGLFLVAITLTSCEKKLDLQPLNDVTSDVVYSTPTGYKQSLAKVYGSFALTGNKGPTGATDIVGLDEGSNADFYRTFWQAQQTSTDETVNGWGDNGVQDFHNMNWTSGNPFLKGLYFRSLYQITLANEFLRQSTDDKLSGRSIAGTDADEIRRNRAEVRFLRAFQYWVLMDMYGNPPFVTENDLIGGALPKQINRADLFKYVESELLAIEAELPAVKTAGNYGRVNKFAAQALLARIYLNAQIYTGTAKNTEAVTYAKKVIDGGFTLLPDYRHLLLADNNINNTEAILTINYDGVKTQLFGGTTFITHAAIGGNMSAPLYGVKEGWAGLRTTKSLVNLFPNADGSTDTRAQFFTDGQTLEINSLSTFKDGYAVTKYRNVTKAGASGSDATFTDIDVPLFRLA